MRSFINPTGERIGYKIFIKESEKDHVILPIKLEFKDANNNDFKNSKELRLNLYTTSEAKKLGLKESSSSMGMFVVFMLIVMVFFFYRRFKKRKKA